MTVGTCNQGPRVTAEETEDEVRLSSNEKLPRLSRDDCLDNAVVVLKSPLGDREVIDDATGAVLAVHPNEQP